MFGNLSGPTLLVILFIVLLLFGAPKLPGLAKSLGQSMRILKKEVRGDEAEAKDTADPAQGASGTSAASEQNSVGDTAPRKSADDSGTDRV